MRPNLEAATAAREHSRPRRPSLAHRAAAPANGIARRAAGHYRPRLLLNHGRIPKITHRRGPEHAVPGSLRSAAYRRNPNLSGERTVR